MFLKCIKYTEDSFIAPIDKTINSSINTINNAIDNLDIVAKEAIYDNYVVDKPINTINKVPIETTVIKCNKNIPHSTRINENFINKPITYNKKTNFPSAFPLKKADNTLFNDNNILKHPLPIISKSLHTENDTVLMLFSCQINIMLAQYIRIFFMVKRYSSLGSPIILDSSHIFSAFGSNEKCKSFSFQLLDTDLSPGKYTYSVEAYSKSFKVLPLGLIIINPHITLFTGNQF